MKLFVKRMTMERETPQFTGDITMLIEDVLLSCAGIIQIQVLSVGGEQGRPLSLAYPGSRKRNTNNIGSFPLSYSTQL